MCPVSLLTLTIVSWLSTHPHHCVLALYSPSPLCPVSLLTHNVTGRVLLSTPCCVLALYSPSLLCPGSLLTYDITGWASKSIQTKHNLAPPACGSVSYFPGLSLLALLCADFRKMANTAVVIDHLNGSTREACGDGRRNMIRIVTKPSEQMLYHTEKVSSVLIQYLLMGSLLQTIRFL